MKELFPSNPSSAHYLLNINKLQWRIAIDILHLFFMTVYFQYFKETFPGFSKSIFCQIHNDSFLYPRYKNKKKRDNIEARRCLHIPSAPFHLQKRIPRWWLSGKILTFHQMTTTGRIRCIIRSKSLYLRKHSASCVFFSPLFLPTFVASL